MTLKSFKV